MRTSRRRWFWIWIETRLPALGWGIVGALLAALLSWLVLAVGGAGCGKGSRWYPGAGLLLFSALVLVVVVVWRRDFRPALIAATVVTMAVGAYGLALSLTSSGCD